jgi:glyceraldehyde 3-phosphate dehydrogenase (phosphorylating)
LTTIKPVSVDSINQAMKAASQSGRLKGILYYVDEELVSGDFIGHKGSSIFDATQTKTLGDRFAKVFSWYDNEWGFANRMLDLARMIGKRL